MSSVKEFLNSVKDYQVLSCEELRKSGDFVKRRSNHCDFSCFCCVNNNEILEKELEGLVKETKKQTWKIPISFYHIAKNTISLKLHRPTVMKSIFLEISEFQSAFGSSPTKLFSGKTFSISCDDCVNELRRVRMTLASRVVAALVTLGGGSVSANGADVIHFSLATNRRGSILVSPVTVSSGDNVSEADFVRMRTEDMLAMGDDRGLGSLAVRQIVDAAIVFDFLSVKLDKPLCLDLSAQPKPTRKSNCKGGPFVLYNYARLCAILERFDQGVEKGIYQPLPSLQHVNYNLLSEKDEWSLVFNLLAEWPIVVSESQELSHPKLHHIPAFLSALAATFSVYYRHTRVLNEGLAHLQPHMQARIHLLLAIKQVFLNAFSLLGITPPTTM